MATQFDEIQPRHEEFIQSQRVFFVGSAPLSGGHVNVSPKGYDALRVPSPSEVVYRDLTGSGNETSGHIRENGRITHVLRVRGPAADPAHLWQRCRLADRTRMGLARIARRLTRRRGRPVAERLRHGGR